MYRKNLIYLTEVKEFIEEHSWINRKRSTPLLKEVNRLIFNIKTIETRHTIKHKDLASLLDKELINFIQEDAAEKHIKEVKDSLEQIEQEPKPYEDEIINAIHICKDIVIYDLNKFIKDTEKFKKRLEEFKDIVKNQYDKGNAPMDVIGF